MSTAGSAQVSYTFLKKTSLFRGTTEEELPTLLGCLKPGYRDYEKNELILRQGEDITSVGLVLSGRAQIIEEDFWGNRNIIADAWPGDLFGESYAFLPGELLRVSVSATEPCSVMMIDARHMRSARARAAFIRGWCKTSSPRRRKNLTLTQKLH
ncbi:MAG: cyclic nucleotide-binding domain-containing protein [Eubacteriales bacterium]